MVPPLYLPKARGWGRKACQVPPLLEDTYRRTDSRARTDDSPDMSVPCPPLPPGADCWKKRERAPWPVGPAKACRTATTASSRPTGLGCSTTFTTSCTKWQLSHTNWTRDTGSLEEHEAEDEVWLMTQAQWLTPGRPEWRARHHSRNSIGYSAYSVVTVIPRPVHACQRWRKVGKWKWSKYMLAWFKAYEWLDANDQST